jgi:hypothetical protein
MFGCINLSDCNKELSIRLSESVGLQNIPNFIIDDFMPLFMTDDIEKGLKRIDGMIGSEFLEQKLRQFFKFPLLLIDFQSIKSSALSE